MKTGQISKKSFLTSLILMTTAFFAGKKSRPASAGRSHGGHMGSPFFIPQRKKLKGYQRESRRSTFNKHRRAA